MELEHISLDKRATRVENRTGELPINNFMDVQAPPGSVKIQKSKADMIQYSDVCGAATPMKDTMKAKKMATAANQGKEKVLAPLLKKDNKVLINDLSKKSMKLPKKDDSILQADNKYDVKYEGGHNIPTATDSSEGKPASSAQAKHAQ